MSDTHNNEKHTSSLQGRHGTLQDPCAPILAHVLLFVAPELGSQSLRLINGSGKSDLPVIVDVKGVLALPSQALLWTSAGVPMLTYL
jgi:hypothetical protein